MQTFAQIGLIRRPQVDAKLRVFLAYQPASRLIVGLASTGPAGLKSYVVRPASPRALVYREIAVVSNRAHQFEIAQHGDGFAFKMDGKIVRFNLSLDTSEPYAQIGAEVSSPGELASGTFHRISIEDRSRTRYRAQSAACRSEDAGVHLVVAGDGFSAEGAFRADSHPIFVGDCAGIPPSSMVNELR